MRWCSSAGAQRRQHALAVHAQRGVRIFPRHVHQHDRRRAELLQRRDSLHVRVRVCGRDHLLREGRVLHLFFAAPVDLPRVGDRVGVVRVDHRSLPLTRLLDGRLVVARHREDALEDDLAGLTSGEIILQSVFSVAGDDEAAVEQAREWKGTMVDAHYTDPIADPGEIYRRGEEEVKDSAFTKQVIASADPNTHVKRISALQKLGATTIVLMNVSGKDPHAALRVYGESVLPALRTG